jgi:hypothetical protein
LFSYFRKNSQLGKILETSNIAFYSSDYVPFRESLPLRVSSCNNLSLARNSLFCNYLRFLTRFGTRIAFRNGMNSEMNIKEAGASPEMGSVGGFLLEQGAVHAMRRCLHELANVFTGLMIAGGLLAQRPELESLQRYVTDLCDGSERGSALVRELRSQLLAVCGEAEAAQPERTASAAQGQ